MQCGAATIMNNTCYRNGGARIGPMPTTNVADSTACCAACAARAGCKSWTFWNQDSCNLFADVVTNKAKPGRCTSGDGSPAPPPPPPKPPSPPPPPGRLPYPDHTPAGPACKDQGWPKKTGGSYFRLQSFNAIYNRCLRCAYCVGHNPALHTWARVSVLTAGGCAATLCVFKRMLSL